MLLTLTEEQQRKVRDVFGAAFTQVVIDARLAAVPEAEAAGRTVLRPAEDPGEGRVWVIEELDLLPHSGEAGEEADLEKVKAAGGNFLWTTA